MEGVAARQALLLEKAIDVIGESGLRGLTHRALDRAAGLPEGSSSVYYRTRAALLAAIVDHVARQLRADVEALSAAVPDDSDDPGAAVEETVRLLLTWLERPAMVISLADLSMEAVRTPELRDRMDQWRDQLVVIVEGLSRRHGRSRPRRRAEAIVGSLVGLAGSALTVPKEQRPEYVRDTVALLLGGLAR